MSETTLANSLHRGKRVRTLDDLAMAVAKKRAVVGAYAMLWKPMPAVFLFNMPGAVILSNINGGVFIYEKRKRTPKYFPNSTPNNV